MISDSGNELLYFIRKNMLSCKTIVNEYMFTEKSNIDVIKYIKQDIARRMSEEIVQRDKVQLKESVVDKFMDTKTYISSVYVFNEQELFKMLSDFEMALYKEIRRQFYPQWGE